MHFTILQREMYVSEFRLLLTFAPSCVVRHDVALGFRTGATVATTLLVPLIGQWQVERRCFPNRMQISFDPILLVEYPEVFMWFFGSFMIEFRRWEPKMYLKRVWTNINKRWNKLKLVLRGGVAAGHQLRRRTWLKHYRGRRSRF